VVVYTSGSSAEPKGVVHTHGSVLRDSYPMLLGGPPDGGTGLPAKLLCAMPFFWVGGILCLGRAIQSPISVLILEKFEPGPALDLIERERATGIMGWPTLIQQLRAHPSFAGRDLSSAPSLTSGPADVALLDTPLPGVPAHRGMSETMGTHIAIEHKVIDPETGEALPFGAEGELLVRGHGLMAGYYKQEPHEFLDDDGWLHTGDRVIMFEQFPKRPFFVGRFGEMIKSQGANVAPKEVEIVLESFPEVRHAFVMGFDHAVRGEEVTAVVVMADDATLDVADLQARCKAELSSFKVPTRFVELTAEDVPWLGSGKPDKLRLRAMVETGAGGPP
jgi:acyl-CoA synthetase (AMP-forming)/AMP-acid ligase II